ncbi:MAG: SpvB/TcaC N-terminal domain-containing protein [Ktedonobacteraceae bacterium]
MGTARIAATQLSLPKGGGAIQGIGETFQAAEFTGTASLSIPLPTSPCRDFEPHLSVDYSSGSGNGIFGLGFGLSLPTISRKTSKGLPRYDDSDTFLLSNAEDLVPANNGQRTETRDRTQYTVVAYHPRLEGLFAIIEQWINQKTGDSHWRVVSRDNVTSLFGTREHSRIADPENTSHVFQWLLAETFDARGNCATYEYAPENSDNVPATLSEVNRTQTANTYLRRITYGNEQPYQEGQPAPQTWHFEMVFDYGEYDLDPTTGSAKFDLSAPTRAWASRPDPFSTYHAGFEIRTHRLCRHVLLFHRFEELGHDPVLVHAMRFHYQESPVVTLLSKVESIGFRLEGGTYATKCLPPLEFSYTPFQPADQVFEPLLGENGQFLPGLNLSPHYQLIDLYGEGIPGILYSDGRATLYWEPEGRENDQGTDVTVRYASPQAPHTLPIEANNQLINQQLMDLTGEGQLDLVVSTAGGAGYYEANADHSWTAFRTFPDFPTDFSNPDNHLVDVTGDGLADILLLEDEWIRVYPSLGERGFGPAFTCERESGVPLPRPGAVNEVLHFADMFGSGMQHLVRITNGSVECWPNLGYGRFGKRVLFENVPRFGEDLDASRLFLADLDGSGTADVIYVHPDRLEIFFNHSGNAFSDPLSLPLPAAWDRINQIEFADVHGSGTTCCVLSDNHAQPRHWCYDFSGGQKPYLLCEMQNNLGARSTITYCSSTNYYLADKKKGTPWIVNLPFPVQVVKQTETFDLVSQTRLVSTYSYHHGYYDGIEREFRGFGLVERQDAETLHADAQPTDVPPVLTRTWYHTGAWQQDGPLSRQYAKEYFSGDTDAHLLPDSVFDALGMEIDADAWHEAFRSLKGTVLREEVYAPTAPIALAGQQQDAPYTVTETNYRVKLLQPKGQNKYGVYFVHPQESLTYDYERNPADPRMHHEFMLRVDAYGNVLRSCSVAYGRRQGTGAEPLEEQLSLKVTAEEDSFLNQTGNGVHLLGVPIENKQYEINGLALPSGQAYCTFEEIATYLERVIGATSSRLLNWQRHYYWSPTQNQPYPLGQVSPQGLLTRTEEAVFAPAQIEQVFAGALAKDALDTLLSGEGGYRQDPDNLYWWNPGLTASYLDAPQFFLPRATTDPYGNATTYAYDAHRILPVQVTDALHNQTTVEAVDYQTLAPQKVRDINGNSSEVLFDALGMVVVTSHYGTENGQAVGFKPLNDYREQSATSMDDVIAYPQTYLKGASTDDVIAHPQTYLKGASSYFYYDLSSWKDHQVPVHAVSLVATHYPNSGPTPIQIALTYHDGFGRALQSTTNVEPGEAHFINSDGPVTVAMTSDRWLTSGHTVYNNKGHPVKQYEPYYISTYQYVVTPQLTTFGVSPTLFYDPLGRLMRTDTPKGFFTKVAFTPWSETYYDEDDTVKDSAYYQNNINNQSADFRYELQALKKAALFYNTPTTKVHDNLGRTILEIQQNKDAQLTTHYEWDIQGRQLASADPRLYAAGKENFRMSYAMTGEVLQTVSADAGTRWQLHNVMGNPIYARDARKCEVTPRYDALHRPIAIHVKGGDGAVPLDQTTERMIYGDNVDENGNLFVIDPEKANLRGQLYRHYDQAGVLQSSTYSILGHPLQTSRQLRQNYKQEANWNDVAAATLATLLQPTSYQETFQYDALGRITAATNHDGNILEPTYHISGRFNQIQVLPQAGQQAEIYV